MPAPIAPAPMTATVASRGNALAVVIVAEPAPEPRSASGESRRTLVEESGDAFAIVRAVAERALQVALEIELLLERVAGGCMQRTLDRREAARRRLRELREQRVDRCPQLGVLDAFPDQSPRGRVFGGQLVAKQREPHRTRVAHEARQEERAPRVGHETDTAERLDEARRSRGDDDVAGERDVSAGACRDAVDD